jgi:hypothetical protein
MDIMLNEKVMKYVDRLETEWEQHGKIIIGVDFDDTISPWRMDDFDFDTVIKTLKTAKETGAYIVIFTACKPDRYPEIATYCESKGLEIDRINETPIDVGFGNHAKIYANIFIDDRAGLHEALDILTLAMYRVRGKKASKFNDSWR